MSSPWTSAAPGRLPCTTCRADNPVGAAFCGRCGAMVASAPAIPCPRCLALVPGTVAFCLQCGFRAQQGEVATGAWGHLVAVHSDGSDGARVPLDKAALSIGRRGCDFAFEDDQFMAPIHARLERRADGAYVVPLDATNGVYRRIVAPTSLMAGAWILLGREVLRYEAAESQPGHLGSGAANVLSFGSPLRRTWGRLVEMTMAGGTGDVRTLWGDEVVVGRVEGEIVFGDDPFLSRRHAVLRPRLGGCELEDLGSSNGSYVRLDGPWRVTSRAQIRAGDQLLRIELDS